MHEANGALDIVNNNVKKQQIRLGLVKQEQDEANLRQQSRQRMLENGKKLIDQAKQKEKQLLREKQLMDQKTDEEFQKEVDALAEKNLRVFKAKMDKQRLLKEQMEALKTRISDADLKVKEAVKNDNKEDANIQTEEQEDKGVEEKEQKKDDDNENSEDGDIDEEESEGDS